MTVDNITLYWFLFYIAIGILGIFLTLVYIASKKPSKSKRN